MTVGITCEVCDAQVTLLSGNWIHEDPDDSHEIQPRFPMWHPLDQLQSLCYSPMAEHRRSTSELGLTWIQVPLGLLEYVMHELVLGGEARTELMKNSPEFGNIDTEQELG